jgi:hypothetical protein
VSAVLQDIASEREQQDAKWGQQNHPNGTSRHQAVWRDLYRNRCDDAARAGHLTWLDILLEEVYEAAAEEEVAELRAELVQVAAVAAAWAEALDRGQS